jgi:hypothetical protein
MAKLLLVPLLLLCVSAASGQSASEIPIQSKDSNSVLTCRPQKPLSHTWICIDQNGKERTNLIIKDKEAK